MKAAAYTMASICITTCILNCVDQFPKAARLSENLGVPLDTLPVTLQKHFPGPTSAKVANLLKRDMDVPDDSLATKPLSPVVVAPKAKRTKRVIAPP